jgi:hypothetical protein
MGSYMEMKIFWIMFILKEIKLTACQGNVLTQKLPFLNIVIYVHTYLKHAKLFFQIHEPRMKLVVKKGLKN